MGMEAKTIKSVLRRKTDAWLASIEDEELRKACQRDTIVTGGSIASMLLGEPVNDFDIYFKRRETTKAVADYYVNQFLANRAKRGGVEVPIYVEELEDVRGKPRVRIVVKSAGVESAVEDPQDYQYFENGNDHDAGEYVSEAFGEDLAQVEALVEAAQEIKAEGEEKPLYSPAFLSSNAISLRGKLQIVLRFYGNPDEIHSTFDFAHCMNYWECATGALVLKPEALETLLSRKLVYTGSLYPVCSVFRSKKFIQRGWKINAGQYLKMCLQIAELDLTDPKVLEDQLTGVDVAYFTEVLNKVKADNPEKINSAYLVEILDRMF